MFRFFDTSFEASVSIVTSLHITSIVIWQVLCVSQGLNLEISKLHLSVPSAISACQSWKSLQRVTEVNKVCKRLKLSHVFFSHSISDSCQYNVQALEKKIFSPGIHLSTRPVCLCTCVYLCVRVCLFVCCGGINPLPMQCPAHLDSKGSHLIWWLLKGTLTDWCGWNIKDISSDHTGNRCPSINPSDNGELMKERKW